MRSFAFLLLLLSACSPATTAPQAIAAPRPTSAPDLSAEIAAAQIALQALSLSATQTPARATEQAQAVNAQATQRVEGYTATAGLWTATADAEQGTATAAAIGTATEGANVKATASAEAWIPYANATYTALKNRQAKDAQRQAWLMANMKYIMAAPYVAGGVVILLLVIGSGLVFWSFWYRVRSEYGPAVVYEDAQPMLPAQVERPRLTLFTGEPGAVSRGEYTELPCSEADMLMIAHYALQRGDLSLGINKWEKRGQSGRIRETRDWFVRMEYAEKDANNEVEINQAGVEFLSAFQASHVPAPLPHRSAYPRNGGVAG